MKKITYIILCVFILSSCGKKTTTENNENTNQNLPEAPEAPVPTIVSEKEEYIKLEYTGIVDDYKNIKEEVSEKKQYTTITKSNLGVRFNVDNVKKASKPIKVHPALDVIQNQLVKEALFIPDAHSEENVAPIMNGLAGVIYSAYANHRPLVLSPDAVWMTISQGASIHIRQNIKKLEPILFKEDKPKELIVRNDSLAEQAVAWQELIDGLAQQTRLYTNNDIYTLFVPEFSTTTNIETTAFQVSLLESYKNIFTYVGETGCGIPYITLRGEKEDWKTIYNNLAVLETIGMGYWAEELRPIIKEFIDVYDNESDLVFWQQIFKDASEYAAYYISGWMLKFYPYTLATGEVKWESASYDQEKGGYKTPQKYAPNKFIKGSDYLLSTLGMDDLPSGLSEIDIIWNDYFNNLVGQKIQIHAGFYGMKQHDDLSIEPFISWAVTRKEAKKFTKELSTNSREEFAHHGGFWSPRLAYKKPEGPIFVPSKFSDSDTSISYLRQIIEKAINENNKFNQSALKDIEIEMIVKSDGYLTNIGITNTENKQLINFITSILRQLPKWKPAKSTPNNVLELMDMQEWYDSKELFDINSNVTFTLFADKK